MPGRPLIARQAARVRDLLGRRDAKSVHDLRVASRRLREALSLAGADAQGKTVRRITRALGQVRDLDVRIGFLRAFLSRHPSADLRLLLGRFEERRRKARRDAGKTLRRVRDSGVLDESTLPSPAMDREFAVRHVFRGLRDVTDLAPFVSREEAADRHHRLRIAARHLRYALEIFRPVFGKSVEPRISALKKLQDLLGEIHDCDVWLASLPAKAEGFAVLRENRFRRRRALYRRLVAWWSGHQEIWKQLKSP